MAHIEERQTKKGTRYRAMVYKGVDPETGSRKFTTKTFDTPEEAAAWAADRELKLSRGTLVEPSKETFGAYGREWLEEAKDGLRVRTFHGYSNSFRRYVEEPYEDCPNVGRIPMDQLRPEHINKLYRWLRKERGLSRSTVKKLHAVVRQILVYAHQTRAIEESIVPLLKVPKKKSIKSKINPMTADELGRFLEAARTVRQGEDGERLPDRYYALWFVLQATGLRPSEALGLKWDALDLDARSLRVRYSLSRVSGRKWKLTEPKTSSSNRTITLPRSAVPVLEEHRLQQKKDRLKAGPEWTDHGFVFTTQTGEPCDWTNLRRHFKRIMRRAGLGVAEDPPPKPKGQPGPPKQGKFRPSHRPYDLRHTHATLSLKAGVPAKVISGRLGHARVAFTMDVYTAWVPDMDEGAADAWDALLEEAEG